MHYRLLENWGYQVLANDHNAYAHALAWPGKQLTLTSIKPKAASNIYLLGTPEPLQWKYDSAQGLMIAIPEQFQNEAARPCQHAWTFKIQSLNA